MNKPGRESLGEEPSKPRESMCKGPEMGRVQRTKRRAVWLEQLKQGMR